MDNASSMSQLFERYLNNEYTIADLRQLQAHFGEATGEERMRELVQAALAENHTESAVESAEERARIDRIAANIDAHMAQRFNQPRRLRLWYAGAAAAAILIAATTAALVFFYGNIAQPTTEIGLASTEILPGGNRATLTLADGRIITLDEAQTGIVIGDGEITYQDGSALGAIIPSEAEESFRNGRDPSHVEADVQMMLSLSTPKGGTYQVTLPDGSKVWLNAASTLRYPSRFPEDVREVFLEGEAFFEIKGIEGTRVSRVPFNVQTSGQTVQVLGTQFNLSAYPDEQIAHTTLVEGKIQVTLPPDRGGKSILLNPGQQATTRGAQLDIHEVDPLPYTAWKDGRFHFDGESIRTVMQKLSRWYDIQVEYRGDVTSHRFSGTMSRFDQIDQVLSKLSKTKQVQFKKEGRKIIVMP